MSEQSVLFDAPGPKAVVRHRIIAVVGALILAGLLALIIRGLANPANNQLFTRTTRSLWRPQSGSRVNRATMTAAMIDSRDFISARRRAETELHLPPGTRIAFTGGKQYQDVTVIWDTLDKVRAKHPDMILLHGGGEGGELIAAKWAENRKVAAALIAVA